MVVGVVVVLSRRSSWVALGVDSNIYDVSEIEHAKLMFWFKTTFGVATFGKLRVLSFRQPNPY